MRNIANNSRARMAFFDDSAVLNVFGERGHQSTKPSSKPSSGKESKFRNWKEDISKDFDDLHQLSHGNFYEKGSVCWEATLEEYKEIVRIVDDELKQDTCALNKTLHEEQSKPRSQRDQRSLDYFARLTSVENSPPFQITMEERIDGHQLQYAIDNFHLPRQERFEYFKNYFAQICDGVSFLHEHGFTHNDLSPDNIMVINGQIRIKIIDFDSAVDVYDESNPRRFVDDDGIALHDWYNMRLYHKKEFRAIEAWKAFELVSTNMNRAVYIDLKAADVYALVLLFWQMVTGITPPTYAWLQGAEALAQQYAETREVGVGDILAQEFERDFDKSFELMMEELEQDEFRDCRNLVQDFLDEIAFTPVVSRAMDRGRSIRKIRVKRRTAGELLSLLQS